LRNPIRLGFACVYVKTRNDFPLAWFVVSVYGLLGTDNSCHPTAVLVSLPTPRRSYMPPPALTWYLASNGRCRVEARLDAAKGALEVYKGGQLLWSSAED